MRCNADHALVISYYRERARCNRSAGLNLIQPNIIRHRRFRKSLRILHAERKFRSAARL